MQNMTRQLESYFSSEGELAHTLTNFQFRQPQQDFATHIAEALNAGDTLMVEAETGVGKTLGYLLPILLSNKKVLISSFTKALQDKIYHDDVNRLRHWVAPDKRVAVLKGRANYLCPEKLKRTQSDAFAAPNEVSEFAQVQAWSYRTKTGDLNELGTLRTRVRSSITLSAEECLGRACESFNQCPFYRARERALSSDVLVVNHQLLVASYLFDSDLRAVVESRDVQLLDEAEHLPELLQNAQFRLFDFIWLKDIVRDLATLVSEIGSEDPLLKRLLQQARQHEQSVARSFDGVFVSNATSFELNSKMVDLLDRSEAMLSEFARTLNPRRQQSRLMSQLLKACAERAAQLQILAGDIENGDQAVWGQQEFDGLVVYGAPSADKELPRFVELDATPKIFVSATLSLGGSFDFFCRRISRQEIRGVSIAGSFNYRSQVLGYRPQMVLSPEEDHYTTALLRQVFNVLPKKTLMLFTSHRALAEAHRYLVDKMRTSLYLQGDASAQDLIKAFSREDAGILMGTRGFWQGIDIKGSGVQCLLIDKLPFRSLDDRLLVAGSGESAPGDQIFAEFLLPDCALRLRQGFGRLIRSEDAQGLFIMGDQRFWDSSYAGFLQQALPEFSWTTDKEAADKFLRADA
jgi:ATP-dependent DNA helicase DinG